MANRSALTLSPARRILLAACAIAVLTMPVLVGPLQAQGSTFEVASVKPSSHEARGLTMRITPGGGIQMANVRLRQLIMFAYGVQKFQVSGGPSWIDTLGYDIVAKGDSGGGEAKARIRLRVLLAERFQLTIREEKKESAILALRAVKNGHKLKESVVGFDGISGRPGQISAERAGTAILASYLSSQFSRAVADETGLDGTFAFRLDWTPDFDAGQSALEKSYGLPLGEGWCRSMSSRM